MLTHGSLFAGIGGFDEGFRRAGFKTLWAVEKEPFCQAVLKTHFPETELFSDVRDRNNLRAVDVVTAGFPCQDLSVAGKRTGLGGDRSSLFWEAHRIIGELQPAWFVIENVPGLFSSTEGRDFALVLNALDERGYGLAGRVLNSQYFGVAQRRRRVFIVGRFGEPCPAEILFESQGGAGDFGESGAERPRAAGEIAGCLGSIGDGGFSTNCEKAADGYLQLARMRGFGDYEEGETASALKQRDFKDATDLVCAGFSVGAGASAGSIGYGEEISVTLRGTAGGNKAGVIGASTDSDRVREFTGLPKGMDSARYRALGNAVTVSVAQWIAERIKAAIEEKE